MMLINQRLVWGVLLAILQLRPANSYGYWWPKWPGYSLPGPYYPVFEGPHFLSSQAWPLMPPIVGPVFYEPSFRVLDTHPHQNPAKYHSAPKPSFPELSERSISDLDTQPHQNPAEHGFATKPSSQEPPVAIKESPKNNSSKRQRGKCDNGEEYDENGYGHTNVLKQYLKVIKTGKIGCGAEMGAIAKGKKVVVVGAGASGLMAANLLAADGFSVTILEAKNKVGGRMETYRYGLWHINLNNRSYVTSETGSSPGVEL